MRGMALGCNVFFFYECKDEFEKIPVSLFKHELEHVRQFLILGPFKLPLNLLFGLVAMVLGKGFYKGNVFEIYAREAEDV